ncbi:methyltransferase family protein [Glaciecola sp. MF2-115]|uniref:methyltransferase family protein n=1 Tax=Glaciecola sp. MF2-115 TaxID=3384827 RepID=UPI0039A3CB9F
MKGLELRIPPAAVAVLLVLAMWGINQVTPSIAISWPIRIAVAVLMLVVSISILLLSIREFSKAKTTLTPLEPKRASALLQSGVFAFTRNPIYLALLICLIAFAVILANAFALLGAVLFYFYLTQFQIKPEERALKECFGEEYLAYLKRVRRWL